jgi:hypothetical protein
LSAVLGSIALLVWSVPELIVNPDFATSFYFPNNEADALLHSGTSAIFVAGAVHYWQLGLRAGKPA